MILNDIFIKISAYCRYNDERSAMMMSPSNYVPLILVVLELVVYHVSGGLLGAGEGEGSCAAPPFRAHYVKWTHGCPGFAPCCSEYGYCRPLVRFLNFQISLVIF